MHYQKELDKTYFGNSMAYGGLKNFSKETASKIKHLILLKIQDMKDVNVDFISFLNQQLAEEFYKQVIGNF